MVDILCAQPETPVLEIHHRKDLQMRTTLNNTSLEEATGIIPYNMTNDYMFRAVLQKNKTVLRGLVGALLHINPELLDVEITNPIELGRSYQNKEFMLDINVIVNGQTRLNL